MRTPSRTEFRLEVHTMSTPRLPGSDSPATAQQHAARRWRNAMFVVFAACGFALAAWVSRTPAVRDGLGASTAEMGWLIFAIAGGAIVGLTSAGRPGRPLRRPSGDPDRPAHLRRRPRRRRASVPRWPRSRVVARGADRLRSRLRHHRRLDERRRRRQRAGTRPDRDAASSTRRTASAPCSAPGIGVLAQHLGLAVGIHLLPGRDPDGRRRRPRDPAAAGGSRRWPRPGNRS